MKSTLVQTPSFSGTGALESLIRSATTSTGGVTREEVLRQLSSYGIEWHITEQGMLWIKSWIISAEDFAPPEQVAKLREGGKMNSEANALEWVSSHLADLRRTYAGKWIAVVGDRVEASSGDLQGLLLSVREKEIELPFITEIPALPVVWTTAYDNQGL